MKEIRAMTVQTNDCWTKWARWAVESAQGRGKSMLAVREANQVNEER
jgi:hypothetical protein